MENQNATTPVLKNVAKFFKLDPQGIRNRILTIRSELGITNNKDFLGILQPITNSITTINNWTNEKDPTVPGLDVIALLARLSGHSMDWIIFGDEEDQAGKDTSEKAEAENDVDLPPDQDTLIKSLLDNFKMPVLQTCAALLNLFKYANISIEGDYGINNFDNPQSLTIKISPKCFSVYGKYDREKGEFFKTIEPADDIETIVYWDIRATLIQCLLATADQGKKLDIFSPIELLKSVLRKMGRNGAPAYIEYTISGTRPIAPFAFTSPHSIYEPWFTCMANDDVLPLDPCAREHARNYKSVFDVLEMENPEMYDSEIELSPEQMDLKLKQMLEGLRLSEFFYDSLSCTLNCEYEKIPDDLKGTISERYND